MFITRHCTALRSSHRHACRLLLAGLLAAGLLTREARAQQQFQGSPQPVVHRIQSQSERLELIVNSSRILNLPTRIPQVQVNNPEILTVTPLSPTEIQVAARKAGVTQINLWDENRQIYTVDVLVVGDARELAMILRSRFPKASLQLTPLSNSVIVSGYVDDPTVVNQIIAVAEDYYPKVHNHIVVGGVQQILLQVRVLEVSRTKLRELGVDFANVSSNGSFATSGISGIPKMATSVPTKTAQQGAGLLTQPGNIATTGAETFSFGIVNEANAFFGFLEALRQDQLAKVLAEPNLVTVSGRPAYFEVGGEFPILVPQSLGTVSVQYRPYGTQVDFVPIVLDNGGIRLEVRPRVSELDPSNGVTLNGTTVPALKVREVDTGVEMRAGQTLAIAGLVSNRVDSSRTSVPLLGDLPWIGAMFRKVSDQMNEVELLILVTPQIVEAMEPYQVPPCGPGMDTTNPTDYQLYARGHIEVPRLCAPGEPGSVPPPPGPGAVPGGPMSGPMMGPGPGAPATTAPTDTLPPLSEPVRPGTNGPLPPPPSPAPGTLAPGSGDMSARTRPAQGSPVTPAPSTRPAAGVSYNRANPQDPAAPPNARSSAAQKTSTPPGFIGPTGYDVLQ